MIRCILCFKNETVSPKLRTDSSGMKMVSYLVLAFGLLCAGAAADSWNFAEDSNKHRSYEQHRKGFNPVTNLCNECLRTVTDMTRVANRKIEMKTCDDFKAKKNEICKKVVVFMRENGRFNLLDSRGLCAKARYCTVKNRIKAKSRPLFVSSSNNRDWSGELGKRRCRAGRNEHDVETTEAPLDLSFRDSKCRECIAITKEIKNYIGDLEPRAFMLPMACSQVRDRLSDHCYNMIAQRGNDIIQFLKAKKTSYQICSAIEECPRRPIMLAVCNPCQNYVRYVKAVGFDDEIMVRWACKEYTGQEKQQCIQALDKYKSRILDTYHENTDENPLEICRKARLCYPVYTSQGAD